MANSGGEVFMSQWVVYFNPLDCPGKYVLRRWDIMREGKHTVPRWTDDVHVADTLDEVRQFVPPGLYCLPRFENDEK